MNTVPSGKTRCIAFMQSARLTTGCSERLSSDWHGIKVKEPLNSFSLIHLTVPAQTGHLPS
jgi:hypothetical protein